MNVGEDCISLRAFSRLRGVALSAVQKAIATGRVTSVKRSDPKDATSRIVGIFAQAATLEWNRNTDPSEAAKSGQQIPATPAGQLDLGASGDQARGHAGEGRDSPAPEKGGAAFYDERTKREVT